MIPEFIGRRISFDLTFGAGLAVNGTGALAAHGEGEADGEFGLLLLDLGDAFGERAGPGFGLYDGELLVAAEENQVLDFGGGAAALSTAVFALDAGARDSAPTGEKEIAIASGIGRWPTLDFRPGVFPLDGLRIEKRRKFAPSVDYGNYLNRCYLPAVDHP